MTVWLADDSTCKLQRIAAQIQQALDSCSDKPIQLSPYIPGLQNLNHVTNYLPRGRYNNHLTECLRLCIIEFLKVVYGKNTLQIYGQTSEKQSK
jgi:hypothetical protein